ncbi:hypothetical protein ACFL2T_00410 [Elusimicrobiota bacterium]
MSGLLDALRRPGPASLLIGTLALVIRLAYWGAAGTPAELKGDALEYHTYAVSMLDDHEFSGHGGDRAGRTPGYPVFLAMIYALSGRSGAAVVAVQCLLGALTCLLLFYVAGRLLDPPWPLVCGLAGTVYFGLVGPTSLLLSECLYGFLLMLSAAALFHQGSTTGRRAFLGGSLLGCTYLVRPEILPAAGLFLILSDRLISGFRRKDMLLGLAGFCLLAGLWAGRNAAVLGRLVPASSRGGSNVYQGLYLPLRDTGMTKEPFYRPPPGLSETEKDARYVAEFKRLWSDVGWGVKIKAYAYNTLSMLYPFLPGYDATFVILLPFWAFGIWACRRRREWWLFGGIVLFSLATYTVFGGPVSRYRQGFSPYLILLGALGMSALLERVHARAFARGAASWAGLNLLIWAFSSQIRQMVLWLRSAIW